MVSMLPRIPDFLANQAIEAFDLGGSIDHPGENGRAREAAIRSFLADILPPDFGIDTGFVIDALGGVSKQVDIVVYWKSRYPVLEVGSVKHFMIESVAAVFEIKADVGSEAVLKEALENIASVKRLDRTGEGRNRVVETSPRPLDPSQTQDQVFGGIVAGHSMTVDNTRQKMVDWMEANGDRRLWPNTYVDVKSFSLNYFHRDNGIMRRRSFDSMTGEGLLPVAGITRTWGPSPPLSFLGSDLLDFLQVVPQISFRVTAGANLAGTGQAGYFYRTMPPVGDGRGLLFSDSVTDADRAAQKEANPPDGT